MPPKRSSKKTNSASVSRHDRRTAQTLSTWRAYQLAILLTVSGAIWLIIWNWLHTPWAPLPWLIGLALWAHYFWSHRDAMPSTAAAPVSIPWGQLTIVLATGALMRLYKITELPLGPSSDEIFTLNNSLALLHRPFDLFGQTPLFTAGWVETTHLYLYFNLLILQIFGVSYWSMKLFSVIPGIVTCAIVFATARLLISPRAALATALLFCCAHWPVRLSRYGWDVSFMVMAYSLAIWLLLFAIRRCRPCFAYFAGVTAGLCLYSYLGARICLLSLLLWFACQIVRRREKWMSKLASAFVIGTTMAAFPLLFYYLAKPSAFWVRTSELNVFNSENPLWQIVSNGWRHGLMFFTFGGAYARDNFPGLPMLDPVSGILLIVGLAVCYRERNNYPVGLIICGFMVNFAAGIFSISQEGAPYVYRIAAVCVPAFMIIGFAVQELFHRLEAKSTESQPVKQFLAPLYGCILAAVIAVNGYYYFGLEAKNIAAMRVMAYEARLLGLEIARDRMPVVLLGRDMIEQPITRPSQLERFASANPPLILPAAMRFLAIVEFSGRFDRNRPLGDNLHHPENINFLDSNMLASTNQPPSAPAKIIFRSQDTTLSDLVRTNYPSATHRQIYNILGEPLFSVATLAQSASTPAAPSATRLP